jgi:hypothetical protein
VPLDADYTLFAVLTLVIMIISLFFTILLLRSKQSPMKKRFEPEIKYTENAETIQETEAVETAEETEAPENLKRTRPTSGCLHYLGYLEKLSTSSFPYECLACPKIGECVGEKGEKKLEKPVIDMSEYRISTRIATTIEKTKNASWKNWRGKHEQAIRAEKVPELYELLRELGGKIKHNDWEYQCFERPVNMVVRAKVRSSKKSR